MKKLFSILCSLLIIGSVAISQTPVNGTVTINVKGNRTKQVVVDNKYYTISNTTASGEQAVVINNMENGQHILELVRTNQYNKSVSTKSSFTLREGFDLVIDISSKGAIRLSETRINDLRAGNDRKAINTAVYNKLYAAVKKKTSSASRTVLLENEFATNKGYTSKQARALIQLVNSESLRLKLAKIVYLKITDEENFPLVSSLLNSTANRTNLNSYIASLPDDNDDPADDTNVFIPLPNEKFQIIYNEVDSETNAADKSYYLNNFFTKEFNYYTSAQTSQLLQLIPTDQERLKLAKIAYRGVTDKLNYSLVTQLINNYTYRADLAAYINSYNDSNETNPGVGVVMSVTEFNKIYQSVYYQNSASSRYASINAAFNTPGNYFSVAQAKQLIQLVNVESSRLLLAKTAYKSLVDRANYTQFNDFLTLQASRNDLANYVNNYDNTANTGIGQAMNEVDFAKLYKSINDAWSSSTKYGLAATAFQNSSNYFTTIQIRQLLLLFASESDRLSLAKISYDNTTDQVNFSQLYDIFSTTDSRNDLAKFVNDTQYGTGTVVRIPMSDAEFNSMVRDVQFTFGFGAKMNSLSQIFNNETNYFTVQQAKQLIQLVSAEYNRLELAKSAYNNITDPANFPQIYDIFSSQASKDELRTYVGSSAYILK